MNVLGEVQSLEDNPCIGWCTTRQFGDDRCKGCGRYEIEVMHVKVLSMGTHYVCTSLNRLCASMLNFIP